MLYLFIQRYLVLSHADLNIISRREIIFIISRYFELKSNHYVTKFISRNYKTYGMQTNYGKKLENTERG